MDDKNVILCTFHFFTVVALVLGTLGEIHCMWRKVHDLEMWNINKNVVWNMYNSSYKISILFATDHDRIRYKRNAIMNSCRISHLGITLLYFSGVIQKLYQVTHQAAQNKSCSYCQRRPRKIHHLVDDQLLHSFLPRNPFTYDSRETQPEASALFYHE